MFIELRGRPHRTERNHLDGPCLGRGRFLGRSIGHHAARSYAARVQMARRGVHCLTSFKATLAHTEIDIEQTAEAAFQAFQVIKRGLDQNDLDALLVADLKKEPFRRLVR